MHLGQAQGITALLRGTHYHAARLVIPLATHKHAYMQADLRNLVHVEHAAMHLGQAQGITVLLPCCQVHPPQTPHTCFPCHSILSSGSL